MHFIKFADINIKRIRTNDMHLSVPSNCTRMHSLFHEFPHLIRYDDRHCPRLLRLDHLRHEAALSPLDEGHLAGDGVGVEERAAAAGGVGRDHGHVQPGVVLERFSGFTLVTIIVFFLKLDLYSYLTFRSGHILGEQKI